MATRVRNAGEFCWINMLTPEPALAREFFGKLLGWKFTALPPMGQAIKVDGHDIGGLFDLNGPSTPAGTPPHIGVMVKVDSADETVRLVSALGGRAQPAFDIMDEGRMAVCFDPNGAAFDIWEPRNTQGTDVDSTLHGAPSWFETLTTDVDAAADFYAGLFGWDPEPMGGSHYTTFRLGSDLVGGMMRITPDMGGIAPHWGVYFTVSKVDEAEHQAMRMGASICVPSQEVPGVGRFCGIISPQGVPFYVIRYA
jgi:predicted enzyme related to lactoylglutathione lyase